MDFKAHLFICTNSPEKSSKCGSKNSEELRRRLKKRANERWGKSVRVNASGCLGHCENGIACVLYPKNKWFLDIREKDEDKLFEALEKAVAEAEAEAKQK